MTPCEQRGWKVGDKFILNDKEDDTFPSEYGYEIGDVVILEYDDETSSPCFKHSNPSKDKDVYLKLDWLTPFKDTKSPDEIMRITRSFIGR